MKRHNLTIGLTFLALFVCGVFSILQSTSFTTNTVVQYQMQPIYSQGDPLPESMKAVTLTLPHVVEQSNQPTQEFASNVPMNIIPRFSDIGKKPFMQTYVITNDGDYVSPAQTQYASYRATIKGNGAVMFRPETKNNMTPISVQGDNNIVVSSAK